MDYQSFSLKSLWANFAHKDQSKHSMAFQLLKVLHDSYASTNISVLGLGYTMVVVSLLIGCYYNVIITYTLRYLFYSLQSIGKAELPWANCENEWNDEKCMDVIRLNKCQNASEAFLDSNPSFNFTSSCKLNHTSRESPSEQFWKNNVLGQTASIDDIGSLRWDLVGFLALAYFILFVCLAKVRLSH